MNRKQDPDLAKIIYLILKCPNTLAGRNEVGLTAMRPVVVAGKMNDQITNPFRLQLVGPQTKRTDDGFFELAWRDEQFRLPKRPFSTQ